MSPDPEVTKSSLPSRIAFGLAVVGALVVLWGLSDPDGELGWLAVGAGALVVGALVWTVALGMAVVAVFSDRPDPDWRWIARSLAVVVALLALVVVNVPWRARWTHSRPDFVAVAAEAEPGLEPDEVRDMGGPRRLGTLDVEWIRQQGDAVVFATETERFGPLGVLYLPEGSDLPTDIGGSASTVSRIGDGWYWWRSLSTSPQR